MSNNALSPLHILYYGAGWPTNIGNAFIDLGAMALLRAACPDAQIGFASEMPRWFFGHGTEKAKMDNALDIASVTQCDLVVFAGMAMCEEFINVNGASVVSLAKRGIPVLLLGTGALVYSDQEQNLFIDFLKRVNPIGFISRDNQSYDLFANCVKESHKGIDCGFFVSEAYTPFPLQLAPYIVNAFDSTSEPKIELKGRKLIRAHHDCWGPSQKNYISTDNTLISDIPQDYLTLYANAEEVHTDRVHACVATLAYGKLTRLYHPTPRGSLFDAVGCAGIREQLTQMDMQLLSEKKKIQTAFAKEIITQIKR